jgi:hypothetical protein
MATRRARNAVRSLLDQYAEEERRECLKRKQQERFAILDLDDPAGVSAHARIRSTGATDRCTHHLWAAAWQAPQRPHPRFILARCRAGLRFAEPVAW